VKEVRPDKQNSWSFLFLWGVGKT